MVDPDKDPTDGIADLQAIPLESSNQGTLAGSRASGPDPANSDSMNGIIAGP